MGNIIASFFSGLGTAIGNLFGSPLEFLSGKSCSSVCGSTWDFICYVENFCVSNLLKMAMVFALLYIVLLFIYLLYKLGICHCVGHSFCKMVWACFASCFYALECCCSFLWFKLLRVKRVNRRRTRYVEEFDYSSSSDEDDDDDDDDGSFSYPRHGDLSRSSLSGRWKDYRGVHLRKSLRPRSHRVRVGIGRDYSAYGSRRNPISKHHGKHASSSTIHNIKVTRTSKFVHKGNSFRGNVHRRRRW